MDVYVDGDETEPGEAEVIDDGIEDEKNPPFRRRQRCPWYTIDTRSRGDIREISIGLIVHSGKQRCRNRKMVPPTDTCSQVNPVQSFNDIVLVYGLASNWISIHVSVCI